MRSARAILTCASCARTASSSSRTGARSAVVVSATGVRRRSPAAPDPFAPSMPRRRARAASSSGMLSSCLRRRYATCAVRARLDEHGQLVVARHLRAQQLELATRCRPASRPSSARAAPPSARATNRRSSRAGRRARRRSTPDVTSSASCARCAVDFDVRRAQLRVGRVRSAR